MGEVTSILDRQLIDLGLHAWTTPPCIIPLSTRARKLLNLPEGIDAVIPRGEPMDFLSKLPEDYHVIEVTDNLSIPYSVIIKEI